MKILFLIPYPLASAPSQRFRFEQYLHFLKEEGHQITVSSFFGKMSWNVLYKPGNVVLKLFGFFRGIVKRKYDLFRATKADIVFIHREAAPLGPPVFEWVIARILRKKIIYDFDDAIWLPNTSKENSFVAWLKWHGKVRSTCKWSWRVSCGNKFLLDYAKQYNSNAFLNPTTIDAENLHDPDSCTKTGVLTIGWTGTHSTAKYLLPLIPVLENLQKQFDFRFLFICNHPPPFELSNLEFRPWKSETEISDLMEIDIGIMPLKDDQWAEGKCGFKALQYMALQIPALVSPVGVNSEIVEHGVQGFHCRTNEEWSTRISELKEDPQIRNSMGQSGRDKVVRQYSVNSNKENFLGLFTQ